MVKSRTKQVNLISILGLAALLLVSSCAGLFPTTHGPDAGVAVQKSPLDQAKIWYVDGSIVYETSMATIQDLRAAHLVTDKQWADVDRAQVQVRTWAPVMRQALRVWESTGQKPADFESTKASLQAAYTTVQSVKAEVKP